MSKIKSPNVFISVVVPVYNTEKYLNQCVDSILGQTFKDLELILVDDGSKDSSPKLCDEYLAKDSRVKVVHQINGGQVKARKAGLMRANGEYVHFVDSDDYLELDALEVACSSAKDNDADIVTFDAYFCYSNRRLPVKQPIKPGVFDKKGLIKNVYPKMMYSGRFFYFGIYAAMWNKIFKRSVLTPNMINVDPRLKIGEDGVTTFATFLDAKKVCVLGGQHLYNYRDNNISITRSYCSGQFDNAKLLIKTLRDINIAKDVYDLTYQIDYYLMYNVYSIFIEEFYYRYHKSLASRIKYLKQIANEESVVSVVKSTNFDNIGQEFEIFFKLLKTGKANSLIITTIYFAIKKRLKLFLRKLLGRY
jgi:glycosyltransferase involved in cell wall biosynthesis